MYIVYIYHKCIMYPMGMVQTYWDTNNEPVSTRHGTQNLTVWPMAVRHSTCAFVLYPLVSLSVPVYRCFLMFYMRRLLHQKKQLHRLVVPENGNIFQNTYWIIDYSFNLYFQKWTLLQTNASCLFQNLSLKKMVSFPTWFTQAHYIDTNPNNAVLKGKSTKNYHRFAASPPQSRVIGAHYDNACGPTMRCMQRMPKIHFRKNHMQQISLQLLPSLVKWWRQVGLCCLLKIYISVGGIPNTKEHLWSGY